ncbi:MAG: hypothetical protein ACI4M9_08465 [Succinivibrio sp.]
MAFIYIFVFTVVCMFFMDFVMLIIKSVMKKHKVNTEEATPNTNKVITLPKTPVSYTKYDLYDIKDRLCEKAGITGFEKGEYDAVQVKRPYGYVVELVRK